MATSYERKEGKIKEKRSKGRSRRNYLDQVKEKLTPCRIKMKKGLLRIHRQILSYPATSYLRLDFSVIR